MQSRIVSGRGPQCRTLRRTGQLVSVISHIFNHVKSLWSVKLTLRALLEGLMVGMRQSYFSELPCHHAIAERVRVTGAARLWDELVRLMQGSDVRQRRWRNWPF